MRAAVGQGAPRTAPACTGRTANPQASSAAHAAAPTESLGASSGASSPAAVAPDSPRVGVDQVAQRQFLVQSQGSQNEPAAVRRSAAARSRSTASGHSRTTCRRDRTRSVPRSCSASVLGVGSSRSQPPPAAVPRGRWHRQGFRSGFHIGLDPRMRVPLPDDEVVPDIVEFPSLVPDDHAGRDPLAAQHQRQGTGEILAMPPAMVDDKILHRIQGEIAAAG